MPCSNGATGADDTDTQLPLQLLNTTATLQVDERLGAVQDLETRLKQSQETADLFTNRERIFDLPPSPFPALAGITSTCCAVLCCAVLCCACLTKLKSEQFF